MTFRWSGLALTLVLVNCRNAELEECNSAKQQAIDQQHALEAEVAKLQKQVAGLSDTEQGAYSRAADLFKQVTNSGDLEKLIAERDAATEALASFLARFPKSQYADTAKGNLDKLQAQLDGLKGEKQELSSFDAALQAQDFSKAAVVIKRLAKLDIDQDSIADLKRKLYEAKSVPKDASLKELENLGRDLIGRRVRVRCQFGQLDQTWVTDLPGVRGSYSSPEGAVYSFNSSAADKWLGLWVREEGTLFQRVFAPKAKFRQQLMAMESDADLVLVGRVVDFGTNNWVALLVEEIQ